MRIFIILILALNQICLGDATSPPAYKLDEVIIGNSRSTTAKSFPREMATLDSEIKTGDQLNASRVALDIVGKCKANMRHIRQSLFDPKHDDTDAYINAWANTLRLWSAITDTSSKQAIMDFWNSGLVDSPEVIDQVRALNDAQAREFFTDNFWNLYANTHDTNLLVVMGHVLAFHGNSQDIQHVKERLASETDIKTKSILSRTVAWFDWVQQGQQKGAEPAQLLLY